MIRRTFISGFLVTLAVSVVGHTVIRKVDGVLRGLTIRGRTIESMAGSCSFEEAVGLIWEGLTGTGPGGSEPERTDDSSTESGGDG